MQSQPFPRWRRITSRVLRAFGMVGLVAGVLMTVDIQYQRFEILRQCVPIDIANIQDMFGGTTEQDRFTEIRFLREWQYKAFRPETDGPGTWFHIELSKRVCGNWTLVDTSQYKLIRPYRVRNPDGIPPELRPSRFCFATD